MDKILERLDHDLVAVNIHKEGDTNIGGGFKIPKTSTNIPFKLATILQVSEINIKRLIILEGEEKEVGYYPGEVVMIRPSKGDAKMEYNGIEFSLINGRDIIGIV